MRAARAANPSGNSFNQHNNTHQFDEEDVDNMMGTFNGHTGQDIARDMEKTQEQSTGRISWASNTVINDDDERRRKAANEMIDDLSEKFRTNELANGVYGRRTSGNRVLKNPIVENIFEEKRKDLTAPVIMKRLSTYLPRSVLGYNSELHLALGFECDLDETYWSHYSTRHDKNRYNKLRREIEAACHNEFNGGGCFPNGSSPPPTIAFYERPPPARLGSFEVMLSLSDAQGGIQHILLHTKLGSAHFPSVKNIVQRIHNIIGSSRAKYHVDASKIKPEVSHPFSQLKRSSRKPNDPTSSHDPNTSFGFSHLPGFNSSHGLKGDGETRAVSETWNTFSGGRYPLKNKYKKQICELCGESDYMKISPVADRFNNAATGKEHGFRSSYNHRLRADQHNSGSLSRFQVRMVGDCCLSRCIGCGWSYLDEANHEQACLPWDDEWMPAELMSSWGLTRFSCRHIPQQRYRAHVPLDSRQRRRVFVDVIDLKAPLQTCLYGPNAPALELVSETTGEVIPLKTIRSSAQVVNTEKFEYASNLLSADVVIPDIYSLRVVPPCEEMDQHQQPQQRFTRSRYQQKNWVHPFEIGYHGPVLMSCEIEFDAAIHVEVRDMAGALLDNATVNLLTPSSDVFIEEDSEKDLLEDMGKSALAKTLGHVYALGRAPRTMTVEIPKIYQLKASLWGHHQIDFMKPFKLDYHSWPRLPSLNQGMLAPPFNDPEEGRSPALTLCITMVRFDVKFLCVDAFGTPLPPQHFQPMLKKDSKSPSFRSSKYLSSKDIGGVKDEEHKGWRLTMTEYCSNTSLPIASYLVKDATCENENERIITVGSLKSPDTSNRHKDQHKMVDKFWSLNVESGKHFVSRIRVGRREVHAGEFKLTLSDWLAGDNVYDHDFNAYGHQSGEKFGNEPLLITVEFGAFDILVLFRNMGFAGAAVEEDILNSKTKGNKLSLLRNAATSTGKKSLTSVVSSAAKSATANKMKEDEGQLFEAPLGTSVALVAVADPKSKSNGSSAAGENGHNINAVDSFVPRRIELSTIAEEPTSFTPDMLRVLRGRYQVCVSAPGFSATAVRIGGVNVGVTNHRHIHERSNEAANKGKSGGLIEFNEQLWRGKSSSGDISSRSECLIEVDLEFDPIPVLAPPEVVSPCPYDLSTNYALVIDICFVIDATGSMGCYLQAAGHAIYNAERDLKIYYPHAKFRYGCIVYRDLDPHFVKKASKRNASVPDAPIEVKPFTCDVDDVEDWLLEVKASGGGDVPEDMFAGLDHAANQMNWQGDVRLCLVISDAPCHGNRFHDKAMEDNFPEEPDPHGHTIEDILTRFKERQIKFVFGKISSNTDIMIKEFQRVCAFQMSQDEQAALRAKQALSRQQDINKANRSRLSRRQQKEMVRRSKLNNGEMLEEEGKEASTAVALTRPSHLHSIQVVDLPHVDIHNYEDMRGEELGKQLDIDEALFEEQSNYLRDVIRESLIVDSVHKEVCSMISMKWSVPSHVIYGSLNVVHYELQHSSLVAPGGLPTASHSQELRRKHLSRTDSAETEVLRTELPPGVSGDQGRHWHSVTVLQAQHTFSVPSAVPSIFRVRAICDDGFKTGFSEEQMFVPHAIEKEQDKVKFSKESLESIDKVIVKRSDHIDAITFVFTDGTMQNFTCLGGEKQQHLEVVDNPYEHSMKLGRSAKMKSRDGSGDTPNAVNEILDLLPAEHILEVKGINSTLHCEAIEFVTSHGRKAK